jgi:hypothetical protein
MSDTKELNGENPTASQQQDQNKQLLQPERNYIKLFRAAPDTIKTSAILFILGTVLDAACQSWGNFCLCVWGGSWILKGFGAIRWIIIISAVLSGILAAKAPTTGDCLGLMFNAIMCVIHIVLLYTASARQWFKTKGEAYMNWRISQRHSAA